MKIHVKIQIHKLVQIRDNSLSSSGFLLLWWNTMTKSQLGRKGFIWLTLPYQHSQSVNEESQYRNPNGAGTWHLERCRGHGQMLLTDLLFVACSACFLIEPRTTSPGMVAPTVGPQSLLMQMPYRLAYSLIFWRHFLDWSSLLSMTPVCVKLT